jgi:hypothetical protein
MRGKIPAYKRPLRLACDFLQALSPGESDEEKHKNQYVM